MSQQRKYFKPDNELNVNVIVIVNDSEKFEKEILPLEEKVEDKLVQDDQSHLLNTFPEEIWLLILEKLKSPNDYFMVSNSSQFFRILLLPKRCLFLFPKVWGLLGMQYETSYNSAYQESEPYAEYQSSEEDEFYPNNKYNNPGYTVENAQKIRPYSVVLKIRQVCRNWCESVDIFYKNLNGFYKMEHDATLTYLYPCKWEVCLDEHEIGCWTRIYDRFSTRRMRQFAKHFGTTLTRSPFLSNELTFWTEDSTGYYARLKQFLSVYGAHVWHCNLTIHCASNLSISTCYLRLCACLQLMPNLKSLKLDFYNIWRITRFYRSHPELVEAIDRRPLPTLKHLKFIKCKRTPSPILDELLSKNFHIDILEIKERCSESSSAWYTEMPNLSQVTLEINDEAEFKILWFVNLKFSKVFLNFKECRYIPWSQIFKLVQEKWGDTATELMLLLPTPSWGQPNIENFVKEHNSLELVMPNVKRLKLILENISTINFLLPMRNSLEHLEVFENYQQLSSDTRRDWKSTGFTKSIQSSFIINLLGSRNGGENTNVWELFPKLKLLEHKYRKSGVYGHLMRYTRTEGNKSKLI